MRAWIMSAAFWNNGIGKDQISTLRPMGYSGGLGRLHAYLIREVETEIGAYGLNRASFDVLATLRRSGDPYELSPSDLLAATMVTSGT